MNLKKIKIIGIILIFILSFLIHNLYELLPSFFTSIISPVNESIFEHNKMILTSFILWGIIEYILLKYFNIKYKNFLSSLFISTIICIFLVMIIFTPIYFYILNKNDNLVITLIIYLISIIFSQILSYYILKSKYNYKILNYLSLPLILLLFVIHGYFTYNPISNALFFDFKYDKYGI